MECLPGETRPARQLIMAQQALDSVRNSSLNFHHIVPDRNNQFGDLLVRM